MNSLRKLPPRMVNYGCTLEVETKGNMLKFILKNKNRNYRGFIYVNSNIERESDSRLTDLYNNFYYETGLMKVENT